MFKEYEKPFKKEGYSVSETQVVNARGDVVAELDQFGDVHTKDPIVSAVLSKPKPAKKDKVVEDK